MGFGETIDKATGGFLPDIVLSKDVIPRYYIIMLFCVLAVFISLRLREGKLGRAWIAIREDELAASAMGIALMRTKLWAYAIGACFRRRGGRVLRRAHRRREPGQLLLQHLRPDPVHGHPGRHGQRLRRHPGRVLPGLAQFQGPRVPGRLVQRRGGNGHRLGGQELPVLRDHPRRDHAAAAEGLLPAARQKRPDHERVDEQSSTLAPGNV
jgi:hypothetical protein